MAFAIADRIQETTTTIGTGTVVLAGAVQGYQSFAIIGNANTTYYTIADQAGTNWEVGIGTYYAGNVSLGRTTVLSSSNSGSLVDFTAGIKAVFVTYPAERAIYADSSNITTITNLVSSNVSITGGNLTSVNVTTTAFSANSVTITGGTINNVSLSNVTYGGLGTMSTQNANAVAITGGSLNNVIVGGTTAANGSFTNLTLTNQLIANASAGTSGQLLTSAGANASPYWATSSSSFPAGTRLLFQQTAAPTGWTKDTTYNNYALRITSGSVTTGGTVGFTTAFASQAVSGTVGTSGSTTATGSVGSTGSTTVSGTVGSTTLSTAQVPNATGTVSAHGGVSAWWQPSGAFSTSSLNASQYFAPTASGGASSVSVWALNLQFGNGSHNHSFSGDAHTHTSGAFTGVAHTHTGGTFTGTAINLAVQYVDAIICTKN